MTQTERRKHLIAALLKEQPQYSEIEIPTSEQEQKILLRSLFNIRMPLPVNNEFLTIQDTYLQEEVRQKGITSVVDLQPLQDGLYLWQGDITTLQCDGIVVGVGTGMSTSAGFAYDGERFERNFADFRKKYGFTDMYSGGFYPYQSLEEYWAWWSKHIYVNRYDIEVGKPYADLLELVKDKDYFVLTTNVDHQFQMAGFQKKRLFYTQGDYGLWQCSKTCHDKTYDNEEAVRQMVAEQKDLRIPSELIPKCPVCGSPMTMNLRCDNSFVQDEGWYAAANRYEDFIRQHSDLHILFLELGVGSNTPVIIKYPFWKMTAQNRYATYACINYGEAAAPKEIAKQAICINSDISAVLKDLG